MFTLLAAIGIMSAMPHEADSILDHMQDKKTVVIGNREFTKGTFHKTPVIFSLAGIGKVAAATTATLLISEFDVDQIIFTGVAGGSNKTNIGDVVIGESFVQHDLDLRPVFPQFYIFTLGKQKLEADKTLVTSMKNAATRFVGREKIFGIENPTVHTGTIVSGDQFISSDKDHQKIVQSTQTVLPDGFHAIEMEGAAVAQVCTELHIPFVVIRAISDKANQEADIDFATFMEKVASRYSLGILQIYFQELQIN